MHESVNNWFQRRLRSFRTMTPRDPNRNRLLGPYFANPNFCN